MPCPTSSVTEIWRSALAAGVAGMARAHLERFLGSPTAESTAREALRQLRRSMDWSDGTSELEFTHLRLDQAGMWVRNEFICFLEMDDKGYSRTCPVDLAHIRAGMSPGMKNVKALCSVCASDPFTCSHVRGRTYVATRQLIGGTHCNVCGSMACQDHRDGDEHEVLCWHLVIGGEATELSIVDRPANGDARFCKIGVPIKDLVAELGPAFEPGMPVRCDQCLAVCQGLRSLRSEGQRAFVGYRPLRAEALRIEAEIVRNRPPVLGDHGRSPGLHSHSGCTTD